MLEEKTYKLIDSYLRKDLSEEERINFEQQIRQDSELASEIEVQRNLYAAIGKTNLEEASFISSEEGCKIQGAIKEAQQNYTQNKVKPLHKRYVMSIAASFLVIVGCFYFFTNTNGSKGLYSEYANWEELPSLTVRGDNANGLTTAEIAFENMQYENAISGFESYLATGSENPQVLIYLGVSFLELDNYEAALTTFQQLKTGNSLDSGKGDWYEALVYLKKKDTQTTISILNRITSNEANFKYKEAKELLLKLD